MPSSTSWQRYDEEHGISAILTEAARACVVENPHNVTDYFVRYFREVSGGTSLRHLESHEVLGGSAESALTFRVELCTGPEVTVTTAGIRLQETKRTTAPQRVSDAGGSGAGKAREVESHESRESSGGAAAVEDARAQLDAFIQTVQTTVVAELLRLGDVEPQRVWDDAVGRALTTAAAAAAAAVEVEESPSVAWCLSLLATLATAKQRRLPLYQHLRAMLETQTVSELKTDALSVARTITSPFGKADTSLERAGAASYTPPHLLVTFLVNDADPLAAESAGQVHFSRVFVSLEPLTSVVSREGDVVALTEGSGSAGGVGSGGVHDAAGSQAAAALPAAADGPLLRQRMRQLHSAAGFFLKANPTARLGDDGCLYGAGSGSYAEVVKSVTDALEAAGLQPGADVAVGLAIGASKVRLRSGKEGHGAESGPAPKAAVASPADPSGLYGLFYGESAITGEQLTEYVKEQLEEMGPGVVQYLQDTHTVDDTVARQRLQLAMQHAIVFSGDDVLDSASFTTGVGYAKVRTAACVEKTHPATVVDLPRCASVQAAVQLLRTAAEANSCAMAVRVGAAAGDAPSAAHVVDFAVAGRAAYIIASTGPRSRTTLALVSRLAAVVAALADTRCVAPRLPHLQFNAYDVPELPEVEVAPIRHKGDKKKKDARKSSGKKK